MPTPKVEVNVAGTWIDVTADELDAAYRPVRNRVRTEAGISITRGAADEQPTVSPGTMRLELNNQDGKYSGRNPNSPYFGQLGRNTPIRVGVDPMSDDFGRSVVDGMGTSSSGHVWSIVSGTASNFDVNGSAATVFTTSAIAQVAVLPNRYGHVTALVKIRFSSMTGTPFAGIVTNWQNDPNHYEVTLSSLGINLTRFADGNTITVDETITVSAATDYWLLVDMSGRLRARVWQDGNPEPDTWTADMWAADPGSFGTIPLLPQLGRVGLVAYNGTSVTVTFDSLTVNSYRFHGEVRSWPPRWDKSGADVSTPIEAVGILNRLGSSGQAELKSAMFREATKDTVFANIANYWPCEDGTNATQLASGVPYGRPLRIIGGEIDPGQSSTIPGSKAMVQLGTGGILAGWVPSWVDTTGNIYFRVNWEVPDTPSTPNDWEIINIYCSGGNIEKIAVAYLTTGAGSLQARAVNSAGTVLDSTTFNGGGPTGFDGQIGYVSLEFVQNGSDVDFLFGNNILSDDGRSVSSFVATDTWTSVTTGRVTVVTFGSRMDGWKICHVGVGNDQSFMFGMTEALVGNAGETAGNRLLRVAEEASIPMQIVGDPDATALMGPQVPGAALDVMRSCAEADQGILFESRNEFGLTYRTLASMYSQTGPVLDYDGGHIDVFEPVEDDLELFNDVTVTRTDGSSERATLDSGNLSTLEPPDGAGRIEAPALDVAVSSDLQLANLASWRLHLFTVDEDRLRALGVQQGASALRADPDLWAQLAALDSADLVAVDNPPSWLPPDRIRQLVRGYTEVIAEDGADLWSLDWNTSPASPYDIGMWDGDESRWDSAATERQGSTIDSTQTAITFTILDGQFWTTDAAHFPFDIMVGGEQMTVTAIAAPSGNTQSFTVTRSVNGVVKSHPTGVTVRLANRTYWGL